MELCLLIYFPHFVLHITFTFYRSFPMLEFEASG